jgi:hypothetical protein
MDFDTQFDSSMKAQPHSFQITRKPKRQKVTAESYPQIMEMSGEFDDEVPETTVQALFFNRQNQNKSYKHVSPWDYEFVQNLMHRTPISNFDINKFHSVEKMRESIEGVTRAYEESFMCEPTGDQRPCSMEEMCEGRFIPQAGSNGFTLREFLLPSQQRTYEQTRRFPLQRAPCIFCKRLQIAKMVVSGRASGTGIRDDMLLQDYYNFVGIPNEYRLEDCLLSKRTVFEGIVSPVVLHVRNAYKFVLKNGVKTYEQWRIPFLTSQPRLSLGVTTPSSSTSS